MARKPILLEMASFVAGDAFPILNQQCLNLLLYLFLIFACKKYPCLLGCFVFPDLLLNFVHFLEVIDEVNLKNWTLICCNLLDV